MYPDNRKYLDILTAAKTLFWKHGFRRVSVEEICKRAGTSKMTYYKFFPNKIELAKTVFNNVVNEGTVRFKEILHSNLSSSEIVKLFIQMKVEGVHDISKEFMNDFYFGSEAELKLFVTEITSKAWIDIANEFKEAQKKGIFRKDFKPEFLLQVSYKLSEFFNDENIMKLYSSPENLMAELTNFIAYGISPRN